MATSKTRRATDKAPAAEQTPATARPEGFTANHEPLTTVTLDAIAAATVAGSYVYLSPEAVTKFGVSVETNASMVFNDYVAARASENVAQSAASTNQPESNVTDTNTATQTAATSSPAANFEIVKGFQMPTPTRAGNGNTKYPFDKLEIGDAFFVTGGTVKSLASTVASANARYAEELKHPDGSTVMRENRKGNQVPATKQLRMFMVRAGVKGSDKGAWIGRIALPNA